MGRRPSRRRAAEAFHRWQRHPSGLAQAAQGFHGGAGPCFGGFSARNNSSSVNLSTTPLCDTGFRKIYLELAGGRLNARARLSDICEKLKDIDRATLGEALKRIQVEHEASLSNSVIGSKSLTLTVLPRSTSTVNHDISYGSDDNDELDAFRSVDFDWAWELRGIWRVPYHVTSLHQSRLDDLVDYFTRRTREPDPVDEMLGRVIIGPAGYERTHLIGELRRRIWEMEGWFVLLDLIGMKEFWSSVALGFLSSLQVRMPDGKMQSA